MFFSDFSEEDIIIEDLKCLTKYELDKLIKTYGQRRRFSKVLIVITKSSYIYRFRAYNDI